MKVEQLSHEASRSARAIADADARAASAHATMMQALQEQKTAEDRAAAAEARVNDAVALRLRSMGADRTQWPEVARKGVEEAEHAAAAAAARAREVEGQLDAVKREVEENAAQQARWRVRGRLCGSGMHFGDAGRACILAMRLAAALITSDFQGRLHPCVSTRHAGSMVDHMHVNRFRLPSAVASASTLVICTSIFLNEAWSETCLALCAALQDELCLCGSWTHAF